MKNKVHIKSNSVEISKEYQKQDITKSLLRIAGIEFKCPEIIINKNNISVISLYDNVGCWI